MQMQGVNPRTAQELMRHSDMKLTNQIYTDANLLPKAAAIHSLPDITIATYTATSDMAKQGIESLSVTQKQEGSDPLNPNDMNGLETLSPEMSQGENGARGGIRTHTGFDAHKALNLACLPISPPEQGDKKRRGRYLCLIGGASVLLGYCGRQDVGRGMLKVGR